MPAFVPVPHLAQEEESLTMATTLRVRFLLWGTLVALAASQRLPAEERPEPFDPATVLKRYVSAEDGAFAFRERRRGKIGSVEFIELILTSQKWRGMLWKHQLFLLRPANVAPDCRTGLLLIGGGSWKDKLERPPAGDETPRDARRMALLATTLRAPVAVLLQVPRQPIFGDKYEDAIISYTFEQFFKSGDPSWPLLLPMVKSAVRAMDAVQAVAKRSWDISIERFTVTGASKRGWTTWLTGAVDPRAGAIAPIVIDVLNMKKHMDLQMRAWGAYSEQIRDYTEKGLHDLLDTPKGRILRRIVDPYSYRKTYRQPKLMLIGTNDRYWPIDALNLYWDDLPSPKYVTYIPNNGHGLSDMVRVFGAVNALHQHLAGTCKLPKLTWDYAQDEGGWKLAVESDRPIREAHLWSADAPKRDFRSAKWTSRKLPVDGARTVARIESPATGYRAAFVEVVYQDGSLSRPGFFSTTVRVLGAEPATAAP